MASPSSQTRMTKDQATALFRSVDDILGFVATDSHLKATRPVKRKLLSRDEVTANSQRKWPKTKAPSAWSVRNWC